MIRRRQDMGKLHIGKLMHTMQETRIGFELPLSETMHPL